MAEDRTQEEALNEETQGGQEQKVTEDVSNSADQADNSSEKNEGTSPEEQLAALNDKYLRLYSEFDNYRKRTNKEKLDLIATASAGVVKDLLGVLDDFDRAIANNETAEDINSVKEGFLLIHNKMKNILESKGLKAMESKGGEFNPDLHEAIANIPAPHESLKGKIVDDVERGYYLNDKVIRYAKVVVGN